MADAPFILLDDQLSGKCRFYQNPIEVLVAHTADELRKVLGTLQSRLDVGRYVAGYISYESGMALESKLERLLPDHSDEPLLLMGVFDKWSEHYPEVPCEAAPRLDLTPDWTEADYLTRFEKVIDYIKAGDVYQINLTFPLRSEYTGTALCLYDTLRARQPVHYGGVISMAGTDIVTFSPELFFETEIQHISMRPMKGTAKRLRDPEADLELRNHMQKDMKSRAENLMIVDLLRNDLSRIAEKASVSVPHLFALETYPTLHQMTSTVTATLGKEVTAADLFKNLFPCGSITGAPKIRAIEIIHELEDGPRGAYCGAIGYMDPGGDACFNVAIRTAIIEDQELRYHVGSGVVLDSDGKAEYEECLLKAKVLSDIPSLVETFRWEPGKGIQRRKRHFARLSSSARTLGYPYDELALQAEVQKIKGETAQKCRLILSENGAIRVEFEDYEPLSEPVLLSLSKHALTAGVQEYRHKVLARDFYDGERTRLQAFTQCNEVIFLNDSDEICEGSFTNIFIESGGKLYTPPLSSGLLPGILRGEYVETGKATEKVLTIEDLKTTDAIYVGNSLRGLLPARFDGFERL